MYVNHDPKPHVIFLSWSMGLVVLRWGVCGGMNRRGYSSTQGSKISKPEGCGEDGEGGCSGRVLGWWGLAFVPAPTTRILWKDYRAGWFVTAPSSSLRLATMGKQMLELQQGVQMTPARHSHTAGRSHSTSSSHTHTLLKQGPTGSQHTHHSLEWLSKIETHLAVLLSSKMNINACS